MSPRPPSDAVVALRSLGRRYRGLFAGLGQDESPDDLALRPGSDGLSGRDHVVAATKAVAEGARALDEALGSLPEPTSAAIGSGATVGEDVDQLAAALGALADRAEHVGAAQWADTGAASTLWEAVDTAIEHLKAAERTLSEVRGRP